MHFKTCVGSENARQSTALGTLKSDLIPISQTCFRGKKCIALDYDPTVFNSDKKTTKCYICRIICVACTFHLRWS